MWSASSFLIRPCNYCLCILARGPGAQSQWWHRPLGSAFTCQLLWCQCSSSFSLSILKEDFGKRQRTGFWNSINDYWVPTLCWALCSRGKRVPGSWVRHRITENHDLMSSPHDSRQSWPQRAPCWGHNQKGWGAERKGCRITSERNWSFFQEMWYLSRTLENENGLTDEKRRKAWQAEQVQCHRTEVGKRRPVGHIWPPNVGSSVRNDFYTVKWLKKSKEEMYFMTGKNYMKFTFLLPKIKLYGNTVTPPLFFYVLPAGTFTLRWQS